MQESYHKFPSQMNSSYMKEMTSEKDDKLYEIRNLITDEMNSLIGTTQKFIVIDIEKYHLNYRQFSILHYELSDRGFDLEYYRRCLPIEFSNIDKYDNMPETIRINWDN